MASRARLSFLLAVLALGCGAKTGLLIPDSGPDGGMDAGAAPDAGFDAGMCRNVPVALERRGAQIMFAIDRSNSMDETIDGRDPGPGELTRWQELERALDGALRGADPLLEVGSKFYPNAIEPTSTPTEACNLNPGVDLAPARNNVDRLLRVFQTTAPSGGTPTAGAIREIGDFYDRRPAPGIPRFVVLATDGGPNCNPDTGIPRTMCICTGSPESCTSPTPEGMLFGPYNCLDRDRTLTAIDALFEGQGVPVYVIGIDDPTRPDLADVLDEMAVAGGRPREVPGERQFYSVREEDDLSEALETIRDSIARCVFTLDPVPGADASLLVRIDDVLVPRDGARTEGWDYTAPDRSEITLFGGACRRVTETDGVVTAEIRCDE